jgi:hypothetical protein
MRARIRDRLAQLHAQRQAAFDMTVLWNKTDNQGAIVPFYVLFAIVLW